MCNVLALCVPKLELASELPTPAKNKKFTDDTGKTISKRTRRETLFKQKGIIALCQTFL